MGIIRLSTINRDYMGLYNSPISVVWDCIGINEEAKLILKHDVWGGGCFLEYWCAIL